MIMTTDCGRLVMLLLSCVCVCVCVCVFFKIKVMFLLKIFLISDEPWVFLHGGGGSQVGEVTRLSI